MNHPSRCLRLLQAAVLIGLLSACATTPPAQPNNLCSMFEEKRGWHSAAVKASEKWGTSMHIPLAFMYQESAFRHKARPPRNKVLGFIPWRRASTAYGYAQVLDGTWREYIKATGEYWRVRHDFADATDFIHWYIREAERRNGVSRSDAFSLYLNYHEGPAGFSRKTHESKPWLIKVATGIQMRSQRYAAQYEGCRDDLNKGLWRRIFSG